MRYNLPEQGNRTGPESVGRLYIRGITVVRGSKPLKELGFVSRQADIGDALNEHNICWAYIPLGQPPFPKKELCGLAVGTRALKPTSADRHRSAPARDKLVLPLFSIINSHYK